MNSEPVKETKTTKKQPEKWQKFASQKLKPIMTQREKDEIEMKRVKTTFKNSEFKRNLRDGTNADQAHLMPALIPVPKTFIDKE